VIVISPSDVQKITATNGGEHKGVAGYPLGVNLLDTIHDIVII